MAPAPAGFDRYPDLLALVRRAFAAHVGRIDPPSSAMRATADSLRAIAEAGTLLLATAADGTLAGCVFGTPQGSDLYLGKLAVDPAWQGRGIGARLVTALADHARAAGFARVTLGVRLALVENIALFAGLGFVRTGVQCHPGFDTPTSQDMVLVL
ncbi:MAG: GNAT family N-acetyltransferase [Alphaproteobacteria bacterium]